MTSDQAYVTLATNDSYGLGALVLGSSLRNSGTSRKLVILITPEVSHAMRNQLNQVFDVVEVVDVLDSQDSANLTLLARPELGVTLTKLHAWNLTQFSKAVFLDADALVLSNVDELFDREELSAVTDVGWPDCFNTGVFVFRPNTDTYHALVNHAREHGSFDGGDQGLLNSFFSSWTDDSQKRLSFIYNMVATAIYSYAPAFKQYGSKVKIVHFLGNTKPWHHTSGVSGQFSPALGNYLHLWWQIFNQQVRGSLQPGLAGLAGRLGQLDLGSHYDQRIGGSSSAGPRESSRRDWESGNIDYLGSDRFENIQRRIQSSIQSSHESSRVSPPRGAAASAAVVQEEHQGPSVVEKAKEVVTSAGQAVGSAVVGGVHAATAATENVAHAVSAGVATAGHAVGTVAVGAAQAAAAVKDSVAEAVTSGVMHAVEGVASLGSAVAEKISEVIHPTPVHEEKKLQSEASRPSPPPGAPGTVTTPAVTRPSPPPAATSTHQVTSTVTVQPAKPVQPVQQTTTQQHTEHHVSSVQVTPQQPQGSTRASPPAQGLPAATGPAVSAVQPSGPAAGAPGTQEPRRPSGPQVPPQHPQQK